MKKKLTTKKNNKEKAMFKQSKNLFVEIIRKEVKKQTLNIMIKKRY